MRTHFFSKTLATLLVIAIVAPTILIPRVANAAASGGGGCIGGLVGGLVGNAAAAAGISVPDNSLLGNFINTQTAGATLGSCVDELILKPLARAIIRGILQQATASIINFINGNNSSGSPSYVRNLSVTLRGVGDAAGISFINQLGTSLRLASSPFVTSIQGALSSAYSQSTSLAGFFAANQCTLVSGTRTLADVNAFISGNWTRGGISTWFSLTGPTANNPYILYQTAIAQLNSNVTQATTNRRQDLIQSGGFMSWCAGDTTPASACVATSAGTCPAGCVADDAAQTGCSPTGVKPSAPCTNPDGTPAQASTPGSVIMSYAQANINSGIGQLISAQDLDGALGAIVTALANRILAGTGLFGSTQSSGGGSGSSGSTPTNTSSVSASNTAIALANAVQTRLTAYNTAANSITDAANTASQVLTDFMNACTAAGTPAATTQAAAAQSAISDEVAPLLINMQEVLSNVAGTQALIDKVKSEAAVAATAAGAPETFAADVAALSTASPTALEVGAIEARAARTTGAYSLPFQTDPRQPPTVSLNVAGGTSIDQMTLIILNVSILKPICVPPVVDTTPPGGA